MLGLETCATLGMLEDHHASALREAGLGYYDHNLDTAPEFYGGSSPRAITRTGWTRSSGCAAWASRSAAAALLAWASRACSAPASSPSLPISAYPESVPINHLMRVKGTPLVDEASLDPFELVRTVAVARITMPRARVRVAAGRQQLGEAVQALCFVAGADSIFYDSPGSAASRVDHSRFEAFGGP